MVLILAEAMAYWHSPTEARDVILGLAVVAAMPVAGSSAGWTRAADGQDGLSKARTALPDAIILDLMLPLHRRPRSLPGNSARRRTRAIPVLILTAKSEESDQVVGFSLGADDYVTKPFSVKVLLQRVKALLRRADVPAAEAAVIEHAGIRVDRDRHEVTVEGEGVELTRTEFRLLECLVRQPGRVFTRAQLMDAAMGEAAVLERTIDVHVKALRRKFVRPDYIETVRGVGYRFRDRLPAQ